MHLDEYPELSEDMQCAFHKRRASAPQAGTESRGLMENLFIDVQTLNILYERVMHFYDTTIILLYPLYFKSTFYRAEANGFCNPVHVSCERLL